MTTVYELKDVAFDYGQGFGLKDINVQIDTSCITAIVGPNGSGKTTLLNLFAFLTVPSSGELRYNNRLLKDNDIAQFKKSVGYIQQNPYLLRGSVQDNVELGLKLRHINKAERSKRALDMMHLLGIEKLADRNARSLSGGEAQKVAIAQVMVLEPQVLILDEPFTFLDKNAIHDLELLILKLRNDLGKTIIFTTHNQYQAQWLSDQVYSVIKGKLFKSLLLNLFTGELDKINNYLDIGAHKVILPEATSHVEHIAIDPKLIVLSKQRHNPSMQNSYPGKIIGMLEDNGLIKVSVDTGEKFQAIISHESLQELDLSMGEEIWIGFKTSSIVIF